MTINLNEISSRVNAATPGPWEASTRGEGQTTFIESPGNDVLNHDELGHGHMRENYSWVSPEDAAFIAHSREDVSALIAEVLKLRDIIDNSASSA